jgi:large repetitive protein
MRSRNFPAAAGIVLFAFLTGCGGGGSASSGPPPLSPGAPLTITTNSPLPGTLRNHAYSVTLASANGIGSLTWSIKPASSTSLFVDGLSIDPSMGVLSGTANFTGTGGFIAQVTDSASPNQITSKVFTITASDPLQAPIPQTSTVGQYEDIVPITPFFQGGVFPFTYSISGALPPGLKLDQASGQIFGSATAAGNYPSALIIQDSFSPPEVASERLTINVVPPPLSIANSLSSRILQNRPFNGRVIATGGIPPYHFALISGSSLPPGLSLIDPSSGQTNGTPTTLGTFLFTVGVTDSNSPPQSTNRTLAVTVAQPLGRNDTVTSATPIGNGLISATISPYIDPPDNAPLAADGDYYKLVSLAGTGAPVHMETQAQRSNTANPLDTVIEIVDGNGNRYSTCRQPGDNSSTFTSACINDDIGGNSSLDSALDFQVPGTTNSAITFYVYVLDWRGNARPDMNYALVVSGVTSPLSIAATPLLPGARGLSYAQQLSSADGIGSVSWSKAGGTLPPGLALSTAGAITGVATTDGTYTFTVQASDSGNPHQTATAQKVIQVADPVKITSSATMPDACVNRPYTFAPQKSGGVPPFSWGFTSNMWVGISLDNSTGVFSGSSSVTGTFVGYLAVVDATTNFDSQNVMLTVKQCP